MRPLKDKDESIQRIQLFQRIHDLEEKEKEIEQKS